MRSSSCRECNIYPALANHCIGAVQVAKSMPVRDAGLAPRQDVRLKGIPHVRIVTLDSIQDAHRANWRRRTLRIVERPHDSPPFFGRISVDEEDVRTGQRVPRRGAAAE